MIEEILLRGIKQNKKNITVHEPEYTVEGDSPPPMNDLNGLRTRIPFTSPLLVQRLVIPYFLHDMNVMVRSFTGSGKTLAYSLPLVELSLSRMIFGVILLPTNALVRQVFRIINEIKHDDLEIMGMYIHGSTSFGKKDEKIVQIREDVNGMLIESDVDMKGFIESRGRILVTTPDVLVDMWNETDLDRITHLVIDEADALINPERPSTSWILNNLDIQRIHISCFSATMNDHGELISSIKNITRIHINSRRSMDHEFVFGTRREIKHLSLLQIITDGIESPTLIFINDEVTAMRLSALVEKSGVYREGDETGSDVLDDFRLKKIWYLFTTDVLSRGVDFYNVKSVINYDIPDTKTQFVHRAGRINRNCQGQKIYTIYSSEDFSRIRIAVEFLEENGCIIPDHITRIIERTK